MRVIITSRAFTWHQIIVELATAVSTRLSFHAAMMTVSVREVLSMCRREVLLMCRGFRRGFLLPAKELLRLPLHHPPPPRYVYFFMLYIICFTSNLSISNHHTYLSSTFVRYLSPPGALSRRPLRYLPHHRRPTRLRRHLPHHHLRSTQVNNRP